MTEEQARLWIRTRYGVSRETLCARYAALLQIEAARQNLVAESTLQQMWTRHLLDSAQLVPLAGGAGGPWLDIGSGAGLPGIITAILTGDPTILVEPRKMRANFLASAAENLDLDVAVHAQRVETFQGPTAGVVTARAVMELDKLFAAASHCTDLSTIWLLPKGRRAHSEVEAARRTWQGVFHVEPSITDPDSGIVVAREVRRR